jgi:uncharacterized C2H2 Zn-finger protein
VTSGRDDSTQKELVMCSKCKEVFETDSKYIQHYNEIMKDTNQKKVKIMSILFGLKLIEVISIAST